MNPQAIGPLTRLARAFVYSLQGLGAALRTQAALRAEVAALAAAIPAAWILTSDALERALLISSWMLVIVVEMINSSIETVVDRIGTERHDLSGRAKDMGSAAVFCAIVLAATVWLILLGA